MIKKSSNPKIYYGGSAFDDDITSDATSDDLFQTKYEWSQLTEPELYDSYDRETSENEWGAAIHEILVSMLFSDIEFYGPGAKEVSDFFDNMAPESREEILKAGSDCLKYGTGYIAKLLDGSGKLLRIRAFNARNFSLEETNSTSLDTTDVDTTSEVDSRWLHVWINSMGDDPRGNWFLPLWTTEPETAKDIMYNPNIAVLQIRKNTQTPYARSMYRESLMGLKALKDMNRSMAAAVKSSTINPRLIAMDTSGLDTVSAMEDAAKKMAKGLFTAESATDGIYVHDKNHVVYYMGGGNSRSGNGGADRVLKAMDYMEPVISSVLLMLLVPLGIVEQTGANKSLIAKQQNLMNRTLKRYKSFISTFFKTQIFRDITNKDVGIRFTTYIEPEIISMLYGAGVISRSKAQELLDIVDNGKIFSTDQKNNNINKTNISKVVKPIEPQNNADGNKPVKSGGPSSG